MLIKALSVEGVGRFHSEAFVNDFGPGVNVLAAGNEAGKSTLFRAIRICLFCRHDSKTQEIKDLSSEGSQLPITVKLTFVRNGRTYVITKSFLRSPSASLTEDGREIARSKQADEAIWNILGVSPGSGRTLDEGAFGLLWVGQGASFTAPVLGTGASSMLNAAIEAEVGALVGGERARKILESINSEVKRFLTDSEKSPRTDGPLHRSIANSERWQAAEAESQRKLSTLDTQFNELAQRRRRHRELTDPVATAEVTQGLLAAKNDLADARFAAQVIRRYEAEENAAKKDYESVAQRLNQHRELTSRIDANRDAEASHASELTILEAREGEARIAIAHTQEQLAGLEEKLQTLSRREQQLEKLATAVIRAQQKNELTRQIKGIENAAQELREIDAQLSQISVTAKIVDDLDDLDRQIASLGAQLSAAAAQLTVEVKPTGAGQVLVGGNNPNGQYSAPVLAPITVTVADMATIIITPAANPRQEKRKALDEERSSHLKSAGIATVAEARVLLSKRRDLEANHKATLTHLKAMNVTAAAEPVIGKLKNSLADIDAAIRTVLVESGQEHLPDTKQLDAEKLALSQERTTLEARRANFMEIRQQQDQALEDAVRTRIAKESKLEVIRNSIAQDGAVCPDSERSARESVLIEDITTAETSYQTAAATLMAKRKTAPDNAEIERVEMRCQRLEQALSNQNNELRQLEREIGQLTGQIQTAGGDGAGEALTSAQEQRVLAEREHARILKRVATLQLLRDTVSSCLVEGRERYYEPVRRHLRPFFNDLFPGSELELGDDFSITGIKRHRSELFERLSDGTQEQIAILVRLAMGAMLAEQGEVVPIILDDALVYSDDDRIQRMFDALSRAGKYQQVIILTCRLRTFGPLGGHTLRVQANTE